MSDFDDVDFAQEEMFTRPEVYPLFQTEELCLKFVKKDARFLSYVVKQTPAICKEAVVRNPMTLAFVKDKNEDICWEAVMRDIRAVKHVPSECLTTDMLDFIVDECICGVDQDYHTELKTSSLDVYEYICPYLSNEQQREMKRYKLFNKKY